MSLRTNRARPRRPRAAVPEDDEDDYEAPDEVQNDDDEGEKPPKGTTSIPGQCADRILS